MRSGATLLATALLGLGFMSIARDARALGPVDLEVAGKLGVGTSPFGDLPNPLGFGLGARGGVSLSGFYGGLSLMYYVGSSQDNVANAGGKVSVSSLLYGIEGGYGGKILGLFTLRGQLGIGNYQLNEGGAQNGNPTNLYLEPGVTALISLGILLLGVDANVLVLPGVADPLNGQANWDAAFTLHAQAGVKF